MLGLTVCDPFLARTTVYDPFLFGGFSVVSMKVKIWAIHVEWARCLVCCPVSWVHFLYLSFEDCLGASSLDILSRPAGFDSSSLPPFFRSFLSGWRAVDEVFLLLVAFLV